MPPRLNNWGRGKSEFHQLRSSIENDSQRGKVEKVQHEIEELRKSLQEALQLQNSRNKLMQSSLERIEKNLLRI